MKITSILSKSNFRFNRVGLISAICLLVASNVAANLRLAEIFSDRMVIQSDKPVPVWGWADPGDRIVLRFGEQQQSAVADDQGKWVAKLSPIPANALGQSLTVTNGDEVIELTDVLVGEVWIAAGQSNMNHGGPDTNTGVYPQYQSDEQSTAPLRVRRFGFGASLTPIEDFPEASRGKELWEDAKSDDQTPLPLYFGRVVRDGVNVPVGIIRVAVSGTNQGAWMSKETLEKFPGDGGNFYQERLASSSDALASKPMKTDDGVMIQSFDDMLEYQTSWPKNRKDRWPGGGLKANQFCNWPTALYNTRIHPLAPFAIRGVIWHQGEGGPRGPYGERLITMFSQWREVFGQDFYAIWGTLSRNTSHQPPLEPVRSSFYRSTTNESIRHAIDLADDKMECVEFYDLGDHNTHFSQKAEAGRRMGLAALDLAYNDSHLYNGPRVKNIELLGDTAQITFDSVGDHIIYEPSIEGVTGVVLIAPDLERRWGQVEVVADNQVKVFHPDIAEIAGLYYGQNVNPHETLFNSSGLPASPFSHEIKEINVRKEPDAGAPIVKALGKSKSELNLGHVRRHGYSFDFRHRRDADELKVQAYIPTEWSGYLIYHRGEVVQAEEAPINGRLYVEFSVKPNDGPYAVCEKGHEEDFIAVNRY